MDRLKNIMFFFREKPIEITFLLNHVYAHILDVTPITRARDNLPQWWKDVPASYFNWGEFSPVNTVKSCPGIIQTLTTGFILPAWCDVAIQTEGEKIVKEEYKYRWKTSDRTTEMSCHPDLQSPGFCGDYWHLKLHSPWFINSPVKLMYLAPFYNFKTVRPYHQPHAIIPGINNNFSTNVFLFFKNNVNYNFMIETGDPLLHIVPLTEKKYEFKIEIVDNNELLRLPSRVPGKFVAKGVKLMSHFAKQEVKK